MRHHLYRMHEAVLRSAPIRPGDRILYLGCNSAAFSAGMADQLARSGELVAVDFSDATLKRAERILARSEMKNAMFFQLAEPGLPFPDQYFDLVIAFGNFERFPMIDRVLEELHRVLFDRVGRRRLDRGDDDHVAARGLERADARVERLRARGVDDVREVVDRRRQVGQILRACRPRHREDDAEDEHDAGGDPGQRACHVSTNVHRVSVAWR